MDKIQKKNNSNQSKLPPGLPSEDAVSEQKIRIMMNQPQLEIEEDIKDRMKDLQCEIEEEYNSAVKTMAVRVNNRIDAEVIEVNKRLASSPAAANANDNASVTSVTALLKTFPPISTHRPEISVIEEQHSVYFTAIGYIIGEITNSDSLSKLEESGDD